METKPSTSKKVAARGPAPESLEPSDVPAATPFRRNDRAYGCAAAFLIAAAIPLAVVAYGAYAWYEISKPIGVVGPDRWPVALADNYERWQKEGANIESMEVFATGADIFNDMAILKLRDKPETWEYFKAWRSEQAMESPEAARERWEEVNDRYPGWGPDLDDPRVEILPRVGQWDATMVRVARDPANETICVDYFFDF